MDIGAVFLILTVALLAGLFISRPFLASQPSQSPALRRGDADQNVNQRSRLLAEYDHYLTVLQELDFDQALGKIPEGDYPQRRLALLQSAADLLRRLDSAEPHIINIKPQDIAAQQLDTAVPEEDRIEAAIAVRRASLQPQAGKPQNIAALNIKDPADNLEAMIAARRRTRQEKSNGFCPHCGKPVKKSDRFCPKCGNSL